MTTVFAIIFATSFAIYYYMVWANQEMPPPANNAPTAEKAKYFILVFMPETLGKFTIAAVCSFMIFYLIQGPTQDKVIIHCVANQEEKDPDIDFWVEGVRVTFTIVPGNQNAWLNPKEPEPTNLCFDSWVYPIPQKSYVAGYCPVARYEGNGVVFTDIIPFDHFTPRAEYANVARTRIRTSWANLGMWEATGDCSIEQMKVNTGAVALYVQVNGPK